MGHALYTGTDYVVHEYSTSVTNPKERSHARPKHKWVNNINPLNAELNPICHLLALLGAYLILNVSRIRVKTGLSERRCERTRWIKVAYYRTFACLCEHVNESSVKSCNLLNSCVNVECWKKNDLLIVYSNCIHKINPYRTNVENRVSS
jgi:hypothetical protein